MRTKKNIYFILLFAISLTANGLFIYSRYTKSVLFKDQEEIILENFTNKNKFEIYAESIILNPFERLLKLDGTDVSLNYISENPKQLFLLISDNTCNSCIHYCLEDIYSLLPDIESKNVIVLGIYDNRRNFAQLSRKYPFQFFLLDKTSILYDLVQKSQNPIFFKIDYPNKIRYAFSAISTYRTLTKSYITTLLKFSEK